MTSTKDVAPKFYIYCNNDTLHNMNRETQVWETQWLAILPSALAFLCKRGKLPASYKSLVLVIVIVFKLLILIDILVVCFVLIN